MPESLSNRADTADTAPCCKEYLAPMYCVSMAIMPLLRSGKPLGRGAGEALRTYSCRGRSGLASMRRTGRFLASHICRSVPGARGYSLSRGTEATAEAILSASL